MEAFFAAVGSFLVMVSYVICRYHVYKEVWSPKMSSLDRLESFCL